MSDFKKLIESIREIEKMPDQPQKTVNEGEIDYLMVDVLGRINQLQQDLESPRSVETIGINPSDRDNKATQLFKEVLMHLDRAYDSAQELYDDGPYGGE